MKFGALTKFGFLANHRKMEQKKRRMNRHKTALQVMAELGSESNAHGLAKIATSNTTKRKVLWALLVIIGFTAATLQLSLLVSKYLSFQVVEVSNMKDGMPVEFPSVTVCNIAHMSLTKINKLLATNTSNIMDWLNFINGTNFAQQDARMDSSQAFFENLEDEARFVGHDLENFIVHCRFNQKACDPSNFTLFFDGKNYFNCFTFNSGYDFVKGHAKEEKILMHATGPQNGLSLIMSLDSEDPPPGGYGIYDIKNHIAHSAGVRVQVHAPNTQPSPADHGFDVPPGYSSSVGLKAILHSRLPDPHGNCTSDDLIGDRHYRNTIFSCLQLCKQKILVKICQCKTAALPMFQGTDEIPYCGTIKNWKRKMDAYMKKEKVELIYLACEDKVLQNLANNRSYETSCGCFQPCKETSYQKSLSLSYWPLEFYQLNAMEEFYKNHEKTKPMQEAFDKLFSIKERYQALAEQGIHKAALDRSDVEDTLRASTLIRQNLLRLNIYLEDLSIVEFTQMPAYDLADLFADIGGTLGLWMGISVLTIMELVELVMRLIILLFNSETQDSRDSDNDEDESPTHQTMLDSNGLSNNVTNSKYDQFRYDKPLFEKNRYGTNFGNHVESPI